MNLNKLKAVLVFVLLLFFIDATAQTVFDFTSLANRQKNTKHLIENVINTGLASPLSPSNEKQWAGAFWAMELLLYKTAETEAKLTEAWKVVSDMPESFQRSLLEVTYTLYPKKFAQPVKALMQSTNSAAVMVRCAEYLLLNENRQQVKKETQQLIAQKFPADKYPVVALLQKRLDATTKSSPSLKELFSKNFLPGETVIFSIQRSNRNYPGLVIIRKADGSFATTDKDKIFNVPQLARAITNYPYYITNGNTPQGIYRWTGFDTSTNSYIGPTTNLQLVMPCEDVSPGFFSGTCSKESYAAMLPASWKTHDALYESYYASMVGRTEIIMHGTTIDPNYYRHQTYFPQTPSLGCLCSYEEWDKNGKLVKSFQQQIAGKLMEMGSENGYVVVVNIGDKPAPVSLKEVEPLLISHSQHK